jgi:hypothetical protein
MEQSSLSGTAFFDAITKPNHSTLQCLRAEVSKRLAGCRLFVFFSRIFKNGRDAS